MLTYIPLELIYLLDDPSIYKVGVGGANRLKNDSKWSVNRVLDIRHLFPTKPNGIVALCQREMGFIRIPNWKQGVDSFDPTVANQFQLKCAGLEAIASVKLFNWCMYVVPLSQRLADHVGDKKIAIRNAIPSYIDKEYVESTLPHTQHRVFNNDIHVVSSPEHCRWVVSKLREDGGCIGFDFHDDILQLASDRGICALIRLKYINDIPCELREFLKNQSISKYTFNGQKKAAYLKSYFIQIHSVHSMVGRDDQVKQVLGVDLGGPVDIENDIELTDAEIQYCAGNVIAYAKLAYSQSVKLESNSSCEITTHRVFGHRIYTVNTSESCRFIINQLRKVTKDCPFVGFDCEWLPTNPRSVITMLQLAGGKGSQRIAALIRLFHSFKIPQELIDFLNDRTIIKAGVGSFRDAQFLAADYGLNVRGVVDLRNLYPQTYPKQPNGLAALAERELHVILDKDKSITLSGFHQTVLSDEQIQYAAGDAIAGANLFDKYWQKCYKSIGSIERFLDKPFEYVDKRSQPTPVAQPHRAPNPQLAGHREFESRVPPVIASENFGTGNAQEHATVTHANNQGPKRRSHNKKK